MFELYEHVSTCMNIGYDYRFCFIFSRWLGAKPRTVAGEALVRAAENVPEGPELLGAVTVRGVATSCGILRRSCLAVLCPGTL